LAGACSRGEGMSELEEKGLMDLWECACGATFESESDAQSHVSPPEHPWLCRMIDGALAFIHSDEEEWWADPNAKNSPSAI
jgi:hypothetical protein